MSAVLRGKRAVTRARYEARYETGPCRRGLDLKPEKGSMRVYSLVPAEEKNQGGEGKSHSRPWT